MSLQSSNSKPRIKWTPEEDKKILELVSKYGTGNWILIAQQIEGKNGKQCRERWTNNLNPELNFSNWTAQEDQTIMTIYQFVGSKWAEIAKFLPGRSANATKNRFRSITRQIEVDSLSLKNSSKSIKRPRCLLPPISQLLKDTQFSCPTQNIAWGDVKIMILKKWRIDQFLFDSHTNFFGRRATWTWWRDSNQHCYIDFMLY